MKDNTDPRDDLIEKMVDAFESILEHVSVAGSPAPGPITQSAYIDAKAAIGWGKLHLATKRDTEHQQPFNELLDMLNIPRGRKP